MIHPTGCSSFADLKTGLEYIFECAEEFNIVVCFREFFRSPQFFIRSFPFKNMPKSKTRLAAWVFDLSEKRMAIPRLNGSEPLELLLEIGIEKVGRDYDFIFAESELCCAEDLKYDAG